MKRVGILLSLLMFIPLSHAERILLEEPQSPPLHRQTTAPDKSERAPQASIHPIVKEQASDFHQAGAVEYRFSISAENCTHNLFYITSRPRLTSGADQWFLKTPNELINLKRDLSDLEHIKLLFPFMFRPQLAASYPLYFKLTPTAQLRYTGVDIRPCNSANIHDSESSHRKGEILLLTKADDERAIVNTLQLNGFIVSERSRFYRKSVFITATGSETKVESVIEKLGVEFPDVIVDRNDYFFPAAQPRAYLRKSLNWPNISQCLAPDNIPLKIGIIDGLIDTSHANLAETEIYSQVFTSHSAKDTTHATVIAALIAGHDKENHLSGLLPKATLYSADVMESSPFGNTASVAAIVRSLDWLHQQSVRLVNLSLAGKNPNRVLGKSLQIASLHGMLIFAAAGNNHQTDQPSYPAGFDKVFAITAIDAANQLYVDANQGSYIDFAAPGVDLWTVDKDSPGQYRTGTSFATPLALAVAATYLSQNPSLPEALLYESMKRNSRDLGAKGHDPKFGWGLIQYQDQRCP